MFAKPQSEHKWLEQLVGEWNFETVCQTPDGNSSTTAGRMICRSLGGMWVICESTAESPEGGQYLTVMTVGFDIARNRYVGTFIGSMMANIWPYEGVMDPGGKRLPLNSEGPSFDGNGNCQYRDIIEILDADSWLFTSELQDQEGNWVRFMNGRHTRC